MNKWLASVAFLLGVGVSASEAQFSSIPITNPAIRTGTGPYFNPYLGGFSPFLGGNYGTNSIGNLNPYSGQILGNAGGLRIGTGGIGTNQTGGLLGNTGLTGMNSNITGHATRFNSYSQYFNNQGVLFGLNGLGNNASSQQNSTSGLGARQNTTGGTGNLLGQGGFGIGIGNR